MFSKFFINRPIFATVLALLIVVAGLVALNILPVAQFPEITPPTVQVSAVYPGANAETVAQTVGLPIEQQVNGVDGMLYMSSNSSSSGAYSLTITFAVGTDIDMATVQVQNRVSVAQSSLPEPVVVQGVTVQKQSSNIVMFLTMTSKDSVYNSLYLTNYAKLNLVDQLSRVPGVGAVNVMGAGDYSMRIWLDPEAMRIRNISPAQVYQSIQSQNREVSAGYIGQPIGQDNKNAFQYTLNVQGRLISPEQFGNIIIRREQDGAMLRLKDIARIDLGSASYSVVSRLKGMPTAAIAIYQQPGSNSLDVSKGVKAKMEELATSFPTGVAYNVTLDTTDVIHASIDEVMVTFFETTLLVVLVIFLFLQNWRAVIIPCITIPVSLIGTLAVMAAFGFSINTLTLFGLILAVAIVVDDAIVVVENASRLLETGQYSTREAVTKAMGEITGPIVGVVLVLLAVFIPTMMISGISGQLYKQFALTIAASTVLSGFNSLTLTPALCALFLKKSKPSNFFIYKGFNKAYDKTQGVYSSSGQAIQEMETLFKEQLGDEFGYEWTSVAYQETQAGNTTTIVLVMALIVAFLVLAAQYESWTSPVAAVIGLPVALLGAMIGCMIMGTPVSVYTQIGIILLVALSAKNGILIVEFARDFRAEGNSIREAAYEAGHVRLRPILMTSFAFVLGVMPLLFATGAGAQSRIALGTAVVFGMAMNTLLATVYIPNFYELMQKLQEKFSRKKDDDVKKDTNM